jgi:hypothetical protein
VEVPPIGSEERLVVEQAVDRFELNREPQAHLRQQGFPKGRLRVYRLFSTNWGA